MCIHFPFEYCLLVEEPWHMYVSLHLYFGFTYQSGFPESMPGKSNSMFRAVIVGPARHLHRICLLAQLTAQALSYLTPCFFLDTPSLQAEQYWVNEYHSQCKDATWGAALLLPCMGSTTAMQMLFYCPAWALLLSPTPSLLQSQSCYAYHLHKMHVQQDARACSMQAEGTR